MQAQTTTRHIHPNENLDHKVAGGVTWTYEWNATNQLKRVLRDGLEVARYSYDPLGRRVEKVAGGVTTSYIYDGSDILRENRSGTEWDDLHVHPRTSDQSEITARLLGGFARALGAVPRVED